MLNTNFTTATLNPFKAFSNLIKAKQSGYVAWIEKLNNEECAFPILEKSPKLNSIDAWESSGSRFVSNWELEKSKIESDPSLHPVEKDLLLNYTTAYGSEEQYQHYLKTGELTFLGAGKWFWVKYQDVIEQRDLNPNCRFVPSVKPKGQMNTPKKLKRKVYAICIENSKEPIKLPWYVKLYNVVTFPFKFIPKKSILRMDKYTLYSFRIGSVTSGYEVEFQIPKKFSF